jgi:hypothetical protein
MSIATPKRQRDFLSELPLAYDPRTKEVPGYRRSLSSLYAARRCRGCVGKDNIGLQVDKVFCENPHLLSVAGRPASIDP